MLQFSYLQLLTHMVRQLPRRDGGACYGQPGSLGAFVVTNGVNRGCVIAPILFSLMSFSMLMDAHLDACPAICIVYMTGWHVNSRVHGDICSATIDRIPKAPPSSITINSIILAITPVANLTAAINTIITSPTPSHR
ncbi:unnamed protein product [Schistocephalus solidus]|uniref:Reverse transcriptase domain-containing protein n=1 Tax=Schistocephalus solidus TaxID=70667 RepID=A0A183SE02_SCHSO|nr:unnamed protein product [Schistocephalus solidus]